MFFFFNDPPPTEIYPFPLPDALPTYADLAPPRHRQPHQERADVGAGDEQDQQREPPGHRPRQEQVPALADAGRSEEHTSELQSRQYLVCRLLLEKKKKIYAFSRVAAR